MGSKKHKGMICVYCGVNRSETADHVFAKEFFVLSQRANLPQVPSCRDCNCEKSKLEHYLTAILPFGGRHPDALENLQTLVPPRLQKNARLGRELNTQTIRQWSLESGILQPVMGIPFDSARLNGLFCYVTRGLMWHHFRQRLAVDDTVSVWTLSDAGKRLFEREFFSKPAADRVQLSLGNNTIRYEGLQAVDAPQGSIWRFEIYGALRVSTGPNDITGTSCQIGAISRPPDTSGHQVALSAGN